MWHPALLWLSARRQHCHCPPKATSLPIEVERVKLEVEMGEEGEIETKVEPDSQEEAKVTVSVRTTCAGITDRSVLRQKLMHLVDFYLEKFGGPVQFLQNTFDTPEAFEDFRKELFKLCPWMDCMELLLGGRSPWRTSPCWTGTLKEALRGCRFGKLPVTWLKSTWFTAS